MAVLSLRLRRGEQLQESEVNEMGIGGLIGVGATLGMVHVLTGPDHMSALAQISCGARVKGFWLGVKWGVGHSLGLLAMYAIFLASGESLNLDAIGEHVDAIVGVVLVAMGLYGLAQAYFLQRKGLEDHEEVDVVDDSLTHCRQENKGHEVAPGDVEFVGTPHGAVKGGDLESESVIDVGGCSRATNPSSVVVEGVGADDARTGGAEKGPCQIQEGQEEVQMGFWGKVLAARERVQGVLAVCVGILHGVAGPGGVLGVLPAVSLSDASHSAAYLASFCVASILIMGVFAAAWGEVTARLGSRARATCVLLAASACISIVVGIVWLLLIVTGSFSSVFD